MQIRSERAEKAVNKAMDYFEIILDVREAPGFVEIVGDIGGDVLTRRFYDDGTVTAR